MVRRSTLPIVLAAVACAVAGGPARAQGPVQAFSGLWTTTPSIPCGTKFYDVSVVGGEIRFRDQDGRVNVEMLVMVRPDGAVTQTIASSQVPVGARWDYSFAGPNELRTRDLSSGRQFVLTRCPAAVQGPGPAGRNGPARSAALVQQYFSSWSSDNGTALGFGNRFYAPEVNFYGKATPKSAVMSQKMAFTQRWPSRSYVIEPGSLNVGCSGDGTDCTVSGVVDWLCSSPERPDSAGSATFSLRLSLYGDSALIVGESGAVIARRTPGLPSPPIAMPAAPPAPAFEPARVPARSPPSADEIELPPVRR